MTLEDLRRYLQRLGDDLQRKFDPSPELSARTALHEFLEVAAKGRSLKVTLEPSRTSVGAPDFVLKTPAGLNVGHVETKAPRSWRDLDAVLESEQLKRYRFQLPNLLVTDYIHAVLLRDGVEVGRAALATKLEPGTLAKIRADDAEHFLGLIDSFLGFAPEPIKTPERLATLLARYAGLVRVAMEDELRAESKEGELHQLLLYFEKYLYPGATTEVFADAIAQSVMYALLVARMGIKSGEPLDIRRTPKMLPESLAFLSSFVGLVEQMKALGTVEWALREACEVLVTVPDSVLHKAGQVTIGARHDPIIYFYEKFLAVYDSDARVDRGVYYTPPPLVQFITRSVDEILRASFDLERGLADHRVTLLDPACGTGTFLVDAAAHALDTVRREDGDDMVQTAIDSHIVKHFVGFEVQPCPYTIAHIKLSAFLADQSGQSKKKRPRPRVYLSNTLSPPGHTSAEADGASLPMIREVVQEGLRANEVKKTERILVIVGNPPYKREAHNKNKFIDELIEDFFRIDDIKIPDRNTTPLQSDELRFLRWSVWKLLETESSVKHGVVAFVTNHAFIRRRLHRGVRKFLFERFHEIYVFDLLGNRRSAYEGEQDENVFPAVQQGICICILVRKPHNVVKTLHATVFHREKIGPREGKFVELDKCKIGDRGWVRHAPTSPYYSFVPRSSGVDTYEEWPRVPDLFAISNSGVITGADPLLVATTSEELETRMRRFLGRRLDKDAAAEAFGLDASKARSWINVVDANRRESKFRQEDLIEWTYRPCDRRYVYMSHGIIKEYRKNIAGSARLAGNLVLAVASGGSEEAPYVWISDGPMPQAVLSSRNHGRAGIFPAFLDSGKGPALFGPDDNMSRICRAMLLRHHGSLPTGKILVEYVYAVLWSEWWRKSYGQRPYEDDDFPRVPIAASVEEFRALANAGARLVKLHLMSAPKAAPLTLRGTGDTRIGQFEYDEANRCIVIGSGALGTIEMDDISFTVGGYKVLRQWFEARKGAMFGDADLQHIRRVVGALRATPAVVKEVDICLGRITSGKGFIAFDADDGETADASRVAVLGPTIRAKGSPRSTKPESKHHKRPK